jgi:hypothetical protein
MPRKRAPGGGRKPGELGLKSATLSLRLPKHMRQALAAAATRNKRRSVSQEIVLRLNSTLIRDRDEADRPRHIRALSEVVARIALGLEGRTKRRWVEDRYTQEQLSQGIDLLLYTYSHGEAVVPPSITAEAARDPDPTHFVARLGAIVAGGVIASLKAAPEPPEPELLPPDSYYPESWSSLWQLEQHLNLRKPDVPTLGFRLFAKRRRK